MASVAARTATMVHRHRQAASKKPDVQNGLNARSSRTPQRAERQRSSALSVRSVPSGSRSNEPNAHSVSSVSASSAHNAWSVNRCSGLNARNAWNASASSGPNARSDRAPAYRAAGVLAASRVDACSGGAAAAYRARQRIQSAERPQRIERQRVERRATQRLDRRAFDQDAVRDLDRREALRDQRQSLPVRAAATASPARTAVQRTADATDEIQG